FKVMTPDGPAEKTTAEVFGGKKVVLFAVPGAFTPTCHMNHLPGFLENLTHLQTGGAEDVACVAVNDVFVMDAWAKASGAKDKITFLADGAGDFARKLGLEVDLSPNGLGVRSKRYSMIVDDGVVTTLNVEDSPGKAEVSGAARILEQ